MSVQVKDLWAKIAISKNLIKEYKTPESERTLYLDNGTEFQFYLKNPNPYHIGIKIYVNEKSIGDMLVLKPGQTYWLDRFIDVDKKFLFSTYEVDDTPEMKYAISRNGKIKVEFYKEREQSTYISTSIPTISSVYYHSSEPLRYTTLTNDSSVRCDTLNMASSTLDVSSLCSALDSSIIDKSSTLNLNNTKSIETGRIEQGSQSNQKFERCNINFENWVSKTEEMLILPNSRKQVRTKDIKKTKKYCRNCGSKVSQTDKFCFNCGTRLN